MAPITSDWVTIDVESKLVMKSRATCCGTISRKSEQSARSACQIWKGASFPWTTRPAQPSTLHTLLQDSKMEDDELQAIRAARMAELRGSGGGSSSSSSSGPSAAFGGPQGGSGGGANAKNQEDQAAQQEEMKRQMLSRILDAEARERRKLQLPSILTPGRNRVLTRFTFCTAKVSRIGLVKPQKARQITDLLIRMAQSGQIRGRITEDQLIGLLDQVDQANSADSGAGKITVSASPRNAG